MTDIPIGDDAQQRASEQLSSADGPDDLRPWEEIETGRFMPRRIRGSYRGGKVGRAFVVPSGPDGKKIRRAGAQ
jgi:hypothetical protein